MLPKNEISIGICVGFLACGALHGPAYSATQPAFWSVISPIATCFFQGGAPLSDPIPEPIVTGSISVSLETLADGLTNPNSGAGDPMGFGRLFVSDQPGILWAINTATGDKSVFMDLSSHLVSLGVFGPGSFDERGLLGFAFHPDYKDNGLLYTYTSEPLDGPADFSTMPPGTLADHQSVIREWHVPNPGDVASVVDPASTRVLLRIDEPQFNHNGGCVAFGPDEMLYISLGDGGGADDRDGQNFIGGPIIGHGLSGNGQNHGNVLGTIIRIDPDGTNSANGNYGIPADNPFVGPHPAVDEIFAYGFRNPWRFSFDSRRGDLYVGDVGQNDIEEIDIVVSGGNYGWNFKEGSFFFDHNGNNPGFVTDVDPGVPGGLIDPIAQYDHDEGIAIVGGFVYRGRAVPRLSNKYIFGDWNRNFFANNGRLFYLQINTGLIKELQLAGQDGLGLSLNGFGQDAEGELYVLGNTTGTPFGNTGVVQKIVSSIITPCPPDFNADGNVNVSDLLNLLASLGACPDPCPPACQADLNGDCNVNVSDLLALLANWGTCRRP